MSIQAEGSALNDRMQGTADDELLEGLAGDDSLEGGAGKDSLEGGAGNDSLQGDAGNDWLAGGDGDDYLVVNGGLDTLDAGAGNDYAQIYQGGALYHFGRGAGQDSIVLGAGPELSVSIVLEAGITPEQLQISRQYSDLKLELVGSPDSLLLQGYFPLMAMLSLKFNDGTVWSHQSLLDRLRQGSLLNDVILGYDTPDLLNGQEGDDQLHGHVGQDSLYGGAGNDQLWGEADADWLQGNTGDDQLYGGSGNDTLDGGAGNDYLLGGDGADQYLFGWGEGQDSINNSDADVLGSVADSIVLGAGISTQQVSLQREYDDLLIRLVGSSDSLRVHAFFTGDANTAAAIEQLRFADGTVWSLQDIKNKVLQGGTDAETLTGYALHNRIEGAEGNDGLFGNVGNDSLYGGTGNDQLYAGAGLDLLDGGAGDDSLDAGDGNDTLDGGQGDDYLAGGKGADVYRFGPGSGQDSIYNNDQDVLGAVHDSIELAAGILPSDLNLRREQDDLLIELLGSPDSLRLQSYFFQDATTPYALENLKFADGTVWTIQDIKAQVLLGQEVAQTLVGYAGQDTISGAEGDDSLLGNLGNDLLQGGLGSDSLLGGDGHDELRGDADNDWLDGGAGNDTLDGGAGNDSLMGGDGADSYLFGRGSGQDSINNYDTNVLGSVVDRIVLGPWISTGQVRLVREQNDLLLQLTDSPDSLRVEGYFNLTQTTTQVVEQIQFADGSLWGIQEVIAKVEPLQSGEVLLNASNVNAELVLRDLASTQVRPLRWGQDLVLQQLNAQDRLRVQNFFQGDAEAGFATELLFTDGQSWSVDDIKQRVIQGTSSNDNLIGYVGADQIQGGDGDDYLEGAAGQDQLSGQGSDDWIAGNEGDDSLDGGSGSDSLMGGSGQDLLLGGVGNDTLMGEAGDDLLDGGLGDDQLYGGDGADRYRFGLGSGQDRINNEDSDLLGVTPDSLVLAGLDASAIRLLRDVSPYNDYRSGDLLIQLNQSQDSVRIENYFAADGTSAAAVERIEFADGSHWSIEQVKTQVLQANDYKQLLIGYDSADQIAAGGGDDSLYGHADNDSLSGDAGNDVLYGGEDDDLLLGGAGNDSLYGDSGNDVLDGGSGNDLLAGGDGGDQYRFGLGSGQDSIDNLDQDLLGSNADSLVLGAGIDASQVRLSRVSQDPWQQNGDLLIEFSHSTDSVRIQNYFLEDATTPSALERIEFADGSHWSIDDIKARVLMANDYNQLLSAYDTPDSVQAGDGNDSLYGHADNDSLSGDAGNDWLYGGADEDLLLGGAGNDSLYGDSGNDWLDGGSGHDLLTGGDGADQYHFGLGSGQDSIDNLDQDLLGSNADSLVLGAGIEASQVRLSRVSLNFLQQNGDLLLEFSHSSDSVRILNYFEQDGTMSYAVEQIEFADGSHWSIDDIKARVLMASGYNQLLTGYDTADAIQAGDGNDSLYGHADNDSLSGEAGNDWLYGGADQDQLLGGEGNDSLYGDSGNDWLDGGSGHDLLTGGDGADQYHFGLGSGQDSIDNWDQDALGSNADRLLLGEGIGAGDIRLQRPDQTTDLLIRLIGQQDSLRIQNYFDQDGTTPSRVEYIELADGSLWDWAKVNSSLSAIDLSLQGSGQADHLTGDTGNDWLQGLQGHDRLQGEAGDDRLEGGAGNDRLLGGAEQDQLTDRQGFNWLDGGAGDDILTGRGVFEGGAGNDTLTASSKFSADTYRFNRGDGQDRLIEQGLSVHSPGLGATDDVLLFGQEIAAEQLWFSQQQQDLSIQLIGTNDRILIQDWYQGAEHQVEYLSVADGRQLLSSQVDALVAAMAAFTPPAAGETSLPSDYQAALTPVIASNWR